MVKLINHITNQNIKLKKITNKSKYCIIFSDLFKLFLRHGSDKVIKSLDEIVNILIKENKTIILPTFNLNFPNTKKTGNSDKYIQTGFVNKYLIKRYNFKRTKKPMYNYAVIGPNSNKILNLKQTTAWGDDSVIGYLVKKCAFGIGLNIDKNFFKWLVIHYCEEKNRVPYRYYKMFRGKNIDMNLKVFEKMYVRNLNLNFVEDGRKLNKILIRKKIIKNLNFKKINISLLNLQKYYIEANKLLNKNIYALVKDEK